MKVKASIWEGCYNKGLKSFITAESFAHPAKYSLGLIQRIFDYCLECGYFKKGDIVGDPFGGVAIGGLVAAYRGLRFIGVELEPKFVGLCRANIKLHRSKLEYLGFPLPVIMQGDSRKFHEHVQASGIVTSPPYADSVGDIQAVISSPPYAVIAAGAGGLNTKPAKHAGQQSGRQASAASQDTDQRYGQTDGQIAALKGGSVEAVVSSPPYADGLGHGGKSPACEKRLATGKVEAVVSSPPWENNSEGSRKGSKMGGPEKALKRKRGHGASDAAVLAQAARDEQKTYGDSPGQIGKEKGVKETCRVCGECLPSAICVTVKIAASKLAKIADGASNTTDSTSGAREGKKQRSTSARSRSDISTSQTHSTTESTTENGKAGITDGVDLLGESNDVKPSIETGINAANAERNPTSLFTIKKPQPKPAGNGTTSFQILQRFAELATTGTTQKQWSENIRCCAKCAESLTCLAAQFPVLALSSVRPPSIQPNTEGGKPEDYWRAMAKVYRSCHTAIKPGGYIVLVVKDYVKGGKRVPLCDDTCRLLEHIGFQMVERIHAMLVKETKHGDLFNGETTSTKSRKSFFRRLAEKNGSPKIDFEEVLIARKPVTT